MKMTLPKAYQARPFTPADAPAVVELFSIYSLATTGAIDFTLEEFQLECQTEGFHPETDILIIAAPDGRVVGYEEYWNPYEPHVHIQSYGCVHPDHQGQGIGMAMVRWLEARARQDTGRAPEGARVTLLQGIPAQNTAAHQLFEQAGFKVDRIYWLMQIHMDTPPPSPCPPGGITIRSMQPGEERAVIMTVVDAFRDHYGSVEEPFEQRVRRWEQNLMTGDNFDPSLWFLAMSGNKIAGVSICRPRFIEDPEMGWVNTLGVRRPWRRQGLGLALLQHSFAAFYRRGNRKVGLGVDASSLTGATRLYEKAGMSVFRRIDTFGKELRPGIELGTTTIEEPQIERAAST